MRRKTVVSLLIILLIILPIVLPIIIALVFAGRSGSPPAPPAIERVTYIIFSGGMYEPGMVVERRTTVYLSGEVVTIERTNYTSEERFDNVGEDRARAFINSFYENNFFSWPDDLSSAEIVAGGGGSQFFEVYAGGRIYRRGGELPSDPKFRNCVGAYLRYILGRGQ